MNDASTHHDQRVAVIGGTGSLGFGLALRLAKANLSVSIGSRSAERAAQAAERALGMVPNGRIDGAVNDQAARHAEFVVVSVPFSSQAENLKQIAPSLSTGQIVIDTTAPLAAEVGGKPTRLVGVWQGSAAQQAREMLPAEVPVVSGLHTVSAALLADLSATLDQDVLLCGKRDDKRRVAALLERIDGVRCVDCGPLETSRITESLTPLLISVNIRYKTNAGVKLTGIPDSSGHRSERPKGMAEDDTVTVT